MRLIDADILKEAFNIEELYWGKRVVDIIDNAPTIPLPDFKEGYKQAIRDGKTNFSRPQGEWIRDNYGDTFCSHCGVECPYNEEGLYTLGHYCHHCGADMREADNEC